jgi:cytochrome c oxidase cbb3-type subunit 3
VLYVGYFHFGPGKSPEEELAIDLQRIESARLAQEKADPGLSEESLLAILADSGRRELGRQQYAEKCASCHAIDGGGQIGPNLTDKYWLHGNGSLLAIAQVVGDGVPAKGMPPWKGMLKKEEFENVVAYVKFLQGKTSAAPKAPQGEAVEN